MLSQLVIEVGRLKSPKGIDCEVKRLGKCWHLGQGGVLWSCAGSIVPVRGEDSADLGQSIRSFDPLLVRYQYNLVALLSLYALDCSLYLCCCRLALAWLPSARSVPN